MAQIKLPTPRMVVFYNGTTDEPDEKILRLTDSFDERTRYLSDIEITVRMVNINYGHSRELLKACKPLYEYSWFVDQIRETGARKKDIDESIRKAVNKMPDDFSIKEFIVRHIAEVREMYNTEYNEAEVMAGFKEEGIEIGRAEGIEIGRAEERARADAAEERVNALEEEVKLLKAQIASMP